MLSTKRCYTKPKQAGLSHNQWLDHIKGCTQGTLSPKEYCARHGLSVKLFRQHDWLERRKQASNKFALVKVNEPVARVSHYEIVYPRGVLLRIPASSSLPALLKSLECYV